jgi:hypothetical protein
MLDCVRGHEVFLGWLSVVSALMFFGSLVAVPWLLIRIPSDFFLRRMHYVDRWRPRHPLLRLILIVVKNLCGGILVLAGIVMLVLPGQGILTILVGLICLDFPGKFALERWLIRRPHVIQTINWLRSKAGREPLMPPSINEK